MIHSLHALSTSAPEAPVREAPPVAPPSQSDPDFKRFMDAVKDTKPVNDEATAKPPMYAVILHNDGSTNPDFVTRVLESAFSIEHSAAGKIMYAAHCHGNALVKIVSKEIAETELQAARNLIVGARRDRDWFTFATRSPSCELTFSIRPETDEEKS
jgi:ATP-dependent Clp protease adapter protein ClpS